MKANQARYPIALMCRLLSISRSGYYAWRDRPVGPRAERDAQLLAQIKTYYARSDGRYGAPKIHVDLQEAGESVGRKRVARLMRDSGLVGVLRRRTFRTTKRREGDRPAPDLVNRRFFADGPDRLWVADITYVPTWEGHLYLAVVLDVFSRRIVGWAMASHMRTELVLDALNMAVVRRRPKGVIHHSDQGSQYTSLAFGKRCNDEGVTPSMGSVGDCYDNAMCESFFATVECEVLHRHRFRTRREAQGVLFAFIDGWYNLFRRHSSLGYLSPAEFERRQRSTQLVA